MFCARQIPAQETRSYATGADFHQIFEKDMNRLYTLGVLLTADHSLAERCFVRGLEDASGSNRVFKDWLESWATRTIIQNAIQMIRPRPGDSGASNGEAPLGQPAELAAVVELPPFERFVFVLSGLERYSDHECALLLHASRGEVLAARTRALESLGNAAAARNQRMSSPYRRLAAPAYN